MGKYMKKSKITGDIAVMEVSISPHQSSSSLGVRTRAKTLALQKQQEESDSSSLYYLQLRSRRLEKPPLPNRLPKNSRPVNSRLSVESKDQEEEQGCFGNIPSGADCGNDSFGENNLEIEARDRSTRESTPCSLIRNSDTVGTPGSTTRRSSSIANNRRVSNNAQRNMPTALDMDEFFAQAEKQQQKLFMEKYNFDIINDIPVPGRYEWEQVIP